MPIYDRMHELLLEERCLHVDETPVQVHHENDRKNKSKSYMWVYTSTALNSQRHIRLFEYAPTRSGHCAETFLEGFAGYLLTDDYVGYNRVETAVHCLCWAHARQKFVDAAPAYAKETDGFGDSLVKKKVSIRLVTYLKKKKNIKHSRQKNGMNDASGKKSLS